VSALPPVADLVPHTAPMLGVDELLECADGRARARMAVRADDRFVRDGRLDSIVLLEYMAQVVAACLGHEAVAEGGAVRVGMVIACREMELLRPSVPVGAELVLEVRRVRGSRQVSHFEGTTRDADGGEVARVALTLVHGERPPD
jgi:predicted hotdog family 3-hydroxylacyl-ACP dehydratase